MKISISYPPLESKKGTPLLSQNRQFQWFNSPTYIYPTVPASAATLLYKNGHQVIWDDGIAEEKTYQEWIYNIKKEQPDLISIETKTPVVKRHWKIINELKELRTKKWKLKIVLVGDHVTALPEESFHNSKVDYVLTGGDYDFLLQNLVNHLTKGEKLEPGIYYREDNQVKNTGHFILNHDLNSLPFVDRDLTKWELYAYKNGNYKTTPGTYTMAARDCWWGKCAFCSWTTIYPGKDYRKRTPKNLLDEIGILIEKYKVKEIMDDSGTFPVGNWLHEFCLGMIERGYNKKIKLNCNMRFGILKQQDYDLMFKAGFRFLLFGLESANQKTLDKINKNLKIDQIEEGCKMAKKAGLEPHVTTMIGYPWETKKDAQKTIDFTKKLFRRGYIDTLQATVIIPYPGTPLYKYSQEHDLLNFQDYSRFDQREQVMKNELTTQDVKELTQELYKSFVSPQFIARKLSGIRSLDDIKFIGRAGKKVLGHLTDFSK